MKLTLTIGRKTTTNRKTKALSFVFGAVTSLVLAWTGIMTYDSINR